MEIGVDIALTTLARRVTSNTMVATGGTVIHFLRLAGMKCGVVVMINQVGERLQPPNQTLCVLLITLQHNL
jgi:hypothetical protein